MTSRLRKRLVEASDPNAEPHCRLTREEGVRRQADTDALFSKLTSQRERADGNEFVFTGNRDDLWSRVSEFVDEEAGCCPFFTFEQVETESGVTLRVLGKAISS
jgi:hypothetical protein